MKFITLGTGHGGAINCYNACFLLEDKGEYFLVDSGGGNGIIKQLRDVGVFIDKIRNIFITHIHMDHILGVLWIIRLMAKKYFLNEIKEKMRIYGNDEVIDVIYQMCKIFLPNDFKEVINTKIILIKIKDNETKKILGKDITFFDISAKKVKQFGMYFSINKSNKFTFIGDEVCSKSTEKFIKNSSWLLADAYMCGKEAEEYQPMIKHHHSTVKFVAQLAERLNVKNLILFHTMDDDLQHRKEKFTNDAKRFFSGKVWVPNDLEKILL